MSGIAGTAHGSAHPSPATPSWEHVAMEPHQVVPQQRRERRSRRPYARIIVRQRAEGDGRRAPAPKASAGCPSPSSRARASTSVQATPREPRDGEQLRRARASAVRLRAHRGGEARGARGNLQTPAAGRGLTLRRETMRTGWREPGATVIVCVQVPRSGLTAADGVAPRRRAGCRASARPARWPSARPRTTPRAHAGIVPGVASCGGGGRRAGACTHVLARGARRIDADGHRLPRPAGRR